MSKKLERLKLVDVLENWREVAGINSDDESTPGELIDEFLKEYGMAVGSFIEAMTSKHYRDNVMAQFIADMYEGRADWKSYVEEKQL